MSAPLKSKDKTCADYLAEILQEYRDERRERRKAAETLHDFLDIYLKAKFPYGKPSDRWRGRW